MQELEIRRGVRVTRRQPTTIDYFWNLLKKPLSVFSLATRRPVGVFNRSRRCRLVLLIVMRKFSIAIPGCCLTAFVALAGSYAAADGNTQENAKITYKIQREVEVESSLQFPTRVLSADGKMVLRSEGHAEKGRLLSFRLYDVATDMPVGPPVAAGKHISALAIAPDNHTIAVCVYHILDSGGKILVYDGRTGEKISSYATGAIKSVEFEPDSKTIRVVCGRAPKG
jgi:hypothetical protein